MIPNRLPSPALHSLYCGELCRFPSHQTWLLLSDTSLDPQHPHTEAWGSPSLPCGFHWVLFLLPALSITTLVPHPSRAVEQFHNPTRSKTSAGRPRTNPSTHKTPKESQGLVMPPQRPRSSQSPQEPQHTAPVPAEALGRGSALEPTCEAQQLSVPRRAERKPSLSWEHQICCDSLSSTGTSALTSQAKHKDQLLPRFTAQPQGLGQYPW